MRAEDIRDQESLKAWLETQPRGASVAIAYRAAMRVFPIWGAAINEQWHLDLDASMLIAFRTGLFTATSHGAEPLSETLLGNSISIGFSLARASWSASDRGSGWAKSEDEAFRATSHAVLSASSAARTVSVIDLSQDEIGAAELAARAVSYAADAAYSVTSSEPDKARASHQDIWRRTKSDAKLIEKGSNPSLYPLWEGVLVGWILDKKKQMLENLNNGSDSRWNFWNRWYASAEVGEPIDPQLQLAILEGIDDETWKDVDAVAARIVKIEREFDGDGADENDDIDRALTALPPAKQEVVQQVSRAMIEHRRELPAAFDTILGFTALEIERLQQKNYRDDAEAEEAQRQIRVLLTLHSAVERLQALVPQTDVMPQEQAEQAEALTRLIYRRFVEWPRAKPGVIEDNVGDLVDNSIRGALIGGFAYVAPMVGVSATAALVAGTVIFGGKKIVDTAKVAKDVFGP